MKSWFSPSQKKWTRTIGKYEIRYSRRSADGLMGRFGGGWNWKLGFQASDRTILFSLLISELTVTRK